MTTHQKAFAMLLLILFLIFIIMPLAFLPAWIDEIFSPDELRLMGVSLENLQVESTYQA